MIEPISELPGEYLFLIIAPVLLLGCPWGIPIPCWTLPYIWGMIIHNVISHRWARAFGWFLIYLVIALGSAVLVMLGGAHKRDFVWLSISLMIMGLQTIFWAVLWLRKRSAGITDGWRTSSLVSIVVSLLLTVPLMFFFAKAFDNMIDLKEWTKQNNKKLELQVSQMERDAKLRWETVGAELGLKDYPNGSQRKGSKGLDGGEQVYLWNNLLGKLATSDTTADVFEFYKKCAEDAGAEVRIGRQTKNWDGGGVRPALVATGKNNIAFIIACLPYSGHHDLTEFQIRLFWETGNGFEQFINNTYSFD